MATVREQLQCFDMSQSFYPNVSYQQVVMTNHYRQNRPYRLFRKSGVSAITMSFGLSGAENVSKIILELNHCRTTGDGIVDIIVNGTTVYNMHQAPRYNFEMESFDFLASSFTPQSNNIKIKLCRNSPGFYWLSDAVIYVERKIDQSEEDIDKKGRELLVITRKLLTEHEKMIREFRAIAKDLDLLHKTINQVKVAGSVAKLGGYLLMLGGDTLELLSAGTGTRIFATMETSGYVIVVGGTATDVGSQACEDINDLAHVAEAETMVQEDRKYLEEISACKKMLQKMVRAKESLYRRKFLHLARKCPEHILGYRLMRLLASDGVLQSSQFDKDYFKTVTEVFEAVSVQAMKKALLGINVFLTFRDLMKSIAEISDGTPSAMAEKLREAADCMERDLQPVKSFFKHALNSLLEQLKEELSGSNLRCVARLLKQMPLFDQINSNYGRLNMSWLNTWVNFESCLSQPQLQHLANALNQVYQQLEKVLRHGQTGTPIDVVIVSHGSIGVPSDHFILDIPALAAESVVPSSVMFTTENLSSVTFYQPWGVLLDARTKYAVIRGTIHPNQTQFRQVTPGTGTRVISNTLKRFNSLNSKSDVVIPNVWCNAISDNDPPFRELLQYIRDSGTSPLRPYIWWRIGSVPTFFLTAMTAIAAVILSTPQNRINIRIHHAQCLNWPSTTTVPPANLLDLSQYHNAVGETFRNPFSMTIV